jgi:hypothetical protein
MNKSNRIEDIISSMKLSEQTEDILSSINYSSENRINMPRHILLDGITCRPVVAVLKEIDVPFVYQTAKMLAPKYYFGDKVEDLLLNLLEVNNGNYEAAKKGVLIIDEVDYLNLRPITEQDRKELSEKEINDITYSNNYKDEIGRDLFLMMSGNTYDVNYNDELIKFDTSDLTVVCVGDFSKEEKKEKFNQTYVSKKLTYKDTIKR